MAAPRTVQPPVEVVWEASELAVPSVTARLAVRTCAPQQLAVRAQVVVAGAIGVPQTFYTAFAQWLAQLGFAVTTFDYRGHAASQRGPLRKNKANLLDWAVDCQAVAQHVRERTPQLPLYWVGHSVGAQLPGMSDPPLPIDGLLCIASGSGYWRDNAPPTRRKVLLWWHVIAPIVTALCGCMPGKRWGLVGNLPAGVIWQWRRWCMHPRYAIGVEGQLLYDAYASARYPLHAMSVEDDEMMSWHSTRSLMGWYRNAPQTMERVRMQDVPQRRIGHFGFFRSEMEPHLWPRALHVLERWLVQGHSARGNPEVAPWAQCSDPQPARVQGQARQAHNADNGQGELFTEVP